MTFEKVILVRKMSKWSDKSHNYWIKAFNFEIKSQHLSQNYDFYLIIVHLFFFFTHIYDFLSNEVWLTLGIHIHTYRHTHIYIHSSPEMGWNGLKRAYKFCCLRLKHSLEARLEQNHLIIPAQTFDPTCCFLTQRSNAAYLLDLLRRRMKRENDYVYFHNCSTSRT